MLDLCSGTGILGLTAARLGARATAVDLSRRAVVNARLNARLNRLALEVLRGDLFEPLGGRRFDLIVSNPPYIPAPPGGAPRGAARAWDAGPDGRAFIDRICARAAEHLRPGRPCAARALEPRPPGADRAPARRARPRACRRRRACRYARPGGARRLDYLRSLGVADGSLAERMVVVEGRFPVAVPEPVA